jgi:FkbM family methyltransferase
VVDPSQDVGAQAEEHGVNVQGAALAPRLLNFKPLLRPSLARRLLVKMRRVLSPQCLVAVPLPWGGCLLVGNTETGRTIFHGIYNEQVEINVMWALLRPGMTVLDLGANQGLFTVVAARAVGQSGRVCAFEPGAWAFGLLQKNCRLNNLGQVVLEKLAVSDSLGHTEFHEVGISQAEYSSLRKPGANVVADITTRLVPTTDLDSYIARNNIGTVHFIKMDVEGGENDVIKGGSALWNSPCPPMVLMEVDDRRTASWGYRGSELLSGLEEKGYEVFQPTARGLIAHALQDRYGFSNFLLVPRARTSEIQKMMAEQRI